MHFYGTNILDGCATNVAGSSVFTKDVVFTGKEGRSFYRKSSLETFLTVRGQLSKVAYEVLK